MVAFLIDQCQIQYRLMCNCPHVPKTVLYNLILEGIIKRQI